ncbi:hypothetical protein HPB48_010731 [Haemaphysalis longicornis]|uniref:Uncharacterized protein n=1 Tax=Haemaphysalis longicornis TaxID=44386 RepID=A0A9J6FWW5_HAELO|nr:hypothetical protein HPB48_010731 [Haemaphysalis longicornis]
MQQVVTTKNNAQRMLHTFRCGRPEQPDEKARCTKGQGASAPRSSFSWLAAQRLSAHNEEIDAQTSQVSIACSNAPPTAEREKDRVIASPALFAPRDQRDYSGRF